MITVHISGPHPDQPSFIRELTISNISGEQPANRDNDSVSTYEVELRVRSTRDDRLVGLRDTAHFEHRYGDDLLSLVSEAIEALGGIRGVDSDLPKR